MPTPHQKRQRPQRHGAAKSLPASSTVDHDSDALVPTTTIAAAYLQWRVSSSKLGANVSSGCMLAYGGGMSLVSSKKQVKPVFQQVGLCPTFYYATPPSTMLRLLHSSPPSPPPSYLCLSHFSYPQLTISPPLNITLLNKCVKMHSLFGKLPLFLLSSEISPCPRSHAAEKFE